ncbi:TPA: hypothetical protein DCR49_04580 [Candidatus Delongbacteria bacterium]|nr:MAG: hypothetical protein A2Y39_06190 [Candidatus Delongbacteria bacterium GWF2_40_14]HAQ61263.1 hypothetical protein [Candidatus Delongbacteria bacterium]
MRYEIKLPALTGQISELETAIKLNSRCFNEIFYKRRVNNIYFDDLKNSSFYENFDGIANRIKYRIRWYGNQFGEIDPILELKIKKGFAGYKESYKLKNFNFHVKISSEEIISQIIKNDIPDQVKEELFLKSPVLFNSYMRKYFITFDKKYRLTLDSEIEYIKFEKGLSSVKMDDESVVLELKYDIEDEPEARKVINDLPVRINKNSKFSRGILMTRE